MYYRKLSHHAPNVLAPERFASDCTAAIPSMMVHVLSWLEGVCKMLLRFVLLDADLMFPSGVAYDRGIGESSLYSKVSRSLSRPDSKATTTLLRRSLSAFMEMVLLLSIITGTEYSVSKVFSFCNLILSWNLTSFLTSLSFTNSLMVAFPVSSASSRSSLISALATFQL